MILIPSRNNTSNETNAGNSMGKLCFFYVCVNRVNFSSLYAYSMRLNTEDRARSSFTSSNSSRF